MTPYEEGGTFYRTHHDIQSKWMRQGKYLKLRNAGFFFSSVVEANRDVEDGELKAPLSSPGRPFPGWPEIKGLGQSQSQEQS